jgi:FMN phosphatase YigB (HAD superfamily)
VPQDCVFFDDMAENAQAAQKEGINGVLFTGAEVLNGFIKELDKK